MRMKLTFLLLASVFFVSCGMPTIFNLTSGEYTFQPVVNSNADSFSSSFTITSTDTSTITTLLDSQTTGPSLMFFYTISGSDDSAYPISSLCNTFIGEFNAKVKKKPFGINNPTYHELVFKALGDDTFARLYEFKGIGDKKFTLPTMILLGNSSTVVPRIDKFTFQAIPTTTDTSQYYISLTVDTDFPLGSFTPIAIDLYNFEGNPFLTKQDEISASQTGEYVFLPDGATELYLNIFCSFTVSGDFTNIFWSNLVYLDKIKLPTP